ncbi:hypothetical protein [Sporosarcina sp. FA9]|uniref:hypothetical protein n=1 Tax=Sporosarcina sp. FA9 TaxID=3413030 RepID=UPI003F65A1E3
MDKSKKTVSSDTLDFLKNNVYNITDVTRHNKLTEMLDRFSINETEEVFIIQNAKNKNAKGVFLDLKYFEELLATKEALDNALDEIIEDIAVQRMNSEANLSLKDVFAEDDIDFEQLMKEIED